MENSVGQQLRMAREKLGVNIEDAARAIHIKLVYLQELENDHPELIPSPVQARGFLRLYASFLRISAQSLIEIWDKPVEPELPPAPTPVVEAMPVEVEQPQEKSVEKKIEPASSELPEAEPKKERESTPVKRSRKSKKTSRARKKNKSVMPSLIIEDVNQISTDISPLAELTLEKVEVEAEKQEQPSEIASSLPIPRKSSEDLFVEIGATLRSRREILNLSLADVERFTYLKRPYLEALEAGRFEELPSTIQGRGMLNNYAAFLSMDEDAVMSQYAAALEAKRLERLPPRKPEPIVTGKIRINIPEPLRKYVNADLLLGGALVLVIFFFLLWGAVSVFGTGGSKPTTEAPSISAMLQTTPTATVVSVITLTPQSVAAPGVATEAAGGVQPIGITPTAVITKNAAPLQLYIVAQQRAYIRVVVDGKNIFDGRVMPGNVYTYSGNKTIELLTGNASALEVYFNQAFLGKLGGVGQVVNLSFTEKGMSTPVPTPTEKPTATSKPTATTSP